MKIEKEKEKENKNLYIIRGFMYSIYKRAPVVFYHASFY